MTDKKQKLKRETQEIIKEGDTMLRYFDDIEGVFSWEHRLILDKAKNIIVKIVEDQIDQTKEE